MPRRRPAETPRERVSAAERRHGPCNVYPTRHAAQGRPQIGETDMRILHLALATALLASAAPWLAACDDPDTVGEKIEETGEEIGDEIDDRTDDER